MCELIKAKRNTTVDLHLVHFLKVTCSFCILQEKVYEQF